MDNPFDTKSLRHILSSTGRLTDSSKALGLNAYLDFYGFSALAARVSCVHRMGCFESCNRWLVGHIWQSKHAENTVLIVHGLFDHTGLFLRLVEALLTSGVNVVAFDLPGHGVSEGAPATICDFDEYGDAICDAIAFAGKADLHPCFIAAQSTGAAATMNYIERYKNALKGLVFLAPLVRPASWWLIKLAYRVAAGFIHRVPRRFNCNSHDEHFICFLKNADKLQYSHVEIEWLTALKRWLGKVHSLKPCHLPTLILQGLKDDTVDWQYNIPKIQKTYSDTHVKYFNGAMHHLVNESELIRAEVFAACVQFLRACSGSSD